LNALPAVSEISENRALSTVYYLFAFSCIIPYFIYYYLLSFYMCKLHVNSKVYKGVCFRCFGGWLGQLDGVP